ncbi:MAG TPA: class I SAM-dependent methyltransferase [Roseococcus sp.]|jgi:SAM-dependent methyltransferase|nr:class I SAM-dependent methyltransferase [Roseococcus sp.]
MSTSLAWEARYAEGQDLFGAMPNDYLRSQSWRLSPGMAALALGDGEGRNGLHLARLGLDVLSVDWSATGLARAGARAAAEGAALRTEQADLTRWHWPEARFDLVAWVYVHLPPADRAVVCAGAVRALKPGGLLLLECFSPAQAHGGTARRSGGPREASLLWTRAIAEREFAGLEVLELLEGTVRLDEGPKHQGEAEVLRALLRRPRPDAS